MKSSPTPAFITPVLAAAGLLLTAMPTSAQVGQQKIDFNYNWPAGLQADVTFTANQSRRSGNRVVSQTIDGSYKMSTTNVDDGLKVQFDSFQAKSNSRAPSQEAQKVQAYMTEVGATISDFVVSKDGELVRLEGIGDRQKAAKAGLAELISGLPANVQPRITGSLETIVSDSNQKAAVNQFWRRDVSVWRGRSEPIGTIHQSDDVRPMPNVPDTSAPTTTLVSFVDLRACSPGALDKQCAYVTIDSVMALKDLSDAQRQKLRGAIPNAPADLKLESMTITSKFALLTDPATLVPYRVRTSRDIVVGFVRGEQRGTTTQSESRETRYAYR